MKFASFAIALIGASLICSCAMARQPGSATAAPRIIKGSALPLPDEAMAGALPRPFRVGAFDVIAIDIFGSPELSGKVVQIDASGRMIFPLIGTLEAAGLTPQELASSIEDRLRGRFLLNPQVTVNLEKIVSQTVTVSGEVKKPGVFPILGRMTLLTAISSAEGWTDYSSKGNVIVFRIVQGEEYAAVYNVKAIQKGNYADPELFAGDVVSVGESQGRRVWKDFLAATPLLAPIIYILGNQ